MKKVLIEEMSWSEFKDAMTETDLVVIPVGSLEEHGRHNPLGVDMLVAAWCAERIGRKANALVAPVMPYGYAASISGFAGTVTLDPELLRRVYFSYAESYIKHSAKRFLWINGHGGNVATLDIVAGDLYDRYGAISTHTEWWTTLAQINPNWPCDDHGGYFETSVQMAVNADIVDMSKAQAAPTFNLTEKITANVYRGVRVDIPIPLHKQQMIGNKGRPPAGANAELGQAMLQAYIDYNVGLANELRKIAQ